MRKNTREYDEGRGLRAAAGGAVGAAGAYVARKTRRKKKMMKKAGASAERAMETIDRHAEQPLSD